MIVYDSVQKFYTDIRRDVTGYGSTAEEAQRSANNAERAIRLRCPRKEPPKPMRRFSLLPSTTRNQ